MSHDDWIGRLLLDRYRPVRVLAEGGQGVVYLARAEGGVDDFVRPVVVKRILPHQSENENNTRLFLREARLLAEMNHPGILSIIDLDAVDDEYIMVLEYVRGAHIGRWAQYRRHKGTSLPWEFAVHVGALIADALHHVHTRTDASGAPYGIVHRDVTPANILVDVSGAVKLADFGIARRDDDKTEQVSGNDVVRGNFSFVSPEVFIGVRPTALADIYSLGMVLHWLMSGTRAQRGENLNETVYKALYVEPERLDELRPDIPTELADLVAATVAKDPERRIADASTLARQLRALLPSDVATRFAEAAGTDLVAEDFSVSSRVPSLAELDASWRDYKPKATAPPPAPATPEPKRKRTALWGLLAAAVLVSVALGAVLLRSRLSPAPGPSEFILVRGDVTPVGESVRDSTEDTSDSSGGSPALAATTADAATGAGAEDAGRPAPTSGDAAAELEGAAGSPGGTVAADGPAATPFSARVLTQTFAERRGAVRRCAEQHLEAESIQVSIRFDANIDGSVRDVAVRPQAVSGTPLGACLSGVALGTHFGRLPEPMTFTIPVTVRRGG